MAPRGQEPVRCMRVQQTATWRMLVARTEAEAPRPGYGPTTDLPGRGARDVALGNVCAPLARAVRQRVLGAALLWRATGQRRWVEAAWAQIAATLAWPEWRAQAHHDMPADLRTGHLAGTLGLACAWLGDGLDAERRRVLLTGLHEKAVQPFRTAVEQGIWYLGHPSNWTVVVVGGMGLCGAGIGETWLVDLARGKLPAVLASFGPDGEFNESPFYANSVRELVWCLDGLGLPITGVEKFCRWLMHVTVPPGRVIACGDGTPGAPPEAVVVARVAAETRDPGLQRWFLDHRDRSEERDLVAECLWWDPDLQPGGIDEPLARAFPAHGGLIVSRTSWDPRQAFVVWGKGGHELHGHHDAGQVGIEGYIVDLGTVTYPAGYFGPERWQFYQASVHGHNVPTIDGAETASGSATLVSAEFAPGQRRWRHDLTALYPGARRVLRTVTHRLPAWVEVVDEIDAGRPARLRVRWHTVVPAQPEAGEFRVKDLHCRVTGAGVRLSAGRHQHAPPMDRDWAGWPMPERHEPYVDAVVDAESARIVTLFERKGHT